MADLKALESAFLKADEAGNTEDAQAFATEIKRLRSAETRPLPANAGAVNLVASGLGMVGDTGENIVNLGRAAYGTAKGLLTGDAGSSPEPLKGSVGTSEWFRRRLRDTGVAGLSPDNPNPSSKMDTAQYDFVSRGGVIPGGALPAAGSMLAEKIGGPQWAGVGAMVPCRAPIDARVPDHVAVGRRSRA